MSKTNKARPHLIGGFALLFNTSGSISMRLFAPHLRHYGSKAKLDLEMLPNYSQKKRAPLGPLLYIVLRFTLFLEPFFLIVYFIKYFFKFFA